MYWILLLYVWCSGILKIYFTNYKNLLIINKKVGELSLYRETPTSSTQSRGSRLWTRSKSSEPLWHFASANYNPVPDNLTYRFNLAFTIGANGFNVIK